MRHDKPRLPVIRLLNDLADRRAILALLGADTEAMDADSIGYAGRRIPPARPHVDTAPPPKSWVDGAWTNATEDTARGEFDGDLQGLQVRSMRPDHRFRE